MESNGEAQTLESDSSGFKLAVPFTRCVFSLNTPLPLVVLYISPLVGPWPHGEGSVLPGPPALGLAM